MEAARLFTPKPPTPPAVATRVQHSFSWFSSNVHRDSLLLSKKRRIHYQVEKQKEHKDKHYIYNNMRRFLEFTCFLVTFAELGLTKWIMGHHGWIKDLHEGYIEAALLFVTKRLANVAAATNTESLVMDWQQAGNSTVPLKAEVHMQLYYHCCLGTMSHVIPQGLHR